MKVQAHHAVRITAFPLCPASLRVPATHHRIACTIAWKSRRIIHREGLSPLHAGVRPRPGMSASAPKAAK